MLREQFEICAGSVTGKDHTFSRKPNQDAYFRAERNGLLVGIVCDGCGDPESPHSEIGARLGAQLVGNELMALERDYWDLLEAHDPGKEVLPLRKARQEMLSTINLLALAMARTRIMGSLISPDDPQKKRYTQVIRDHFLFTIVGYAITPHHALFFSIGDGTLIINEEPIPLGPFPNNTPPYATYGLLDSKLLKTDPGCLEFKLHRVMPTFDLESFLIGSDGAGEIETRSGDLMPGGKEFLGPLSQFWMDDRYFGNPEAVNRKLALANADKQHVDWEKRSIKKWGQLLHDDTTLIAGRRRP